MGAAPEEDGGPSGSTRRYAPSLRLQVALLLAFATLPVGFLAVAQGYASLNDTRRLHRATLASEAPRPR